MALDSLEESDWISDDLEAQRLRNIERIKEQVRLDAEKLWIDPGVLYAIRQDL